MSTKTPMMVSLRAALLIGGTVVISFFLGILAVRAAPGVLGGKTSDKLAFAGVLKGAPSGSQLEFRFKKAGVAVLCAQPALTGSITIDSEDRFQTEIDLSGCPATLFDGQDVQFDVYISGGLLIARDQSVSPVAKHRS